MSRYRHALPQAEGGLFITDGGMETDLIFNRGVELPLFAAFVLLESEEGRSALVDYYERYLAIARSRGAGIVLDSATWRANPDWAAKLGHDAASLKRLQEDAVALVEGLREKWETAATPCVLNGVLGPRGDGYKQGRMEPEEARDYHAPQVGAFAGTAADMVSAITMTTVGEAQGIAMAARDAAMPCVVSFTVETDGRLVDGTTLREAIETVDEATGGAPAYYMVNCAHPTHFAREFEAGNGWLKRVGGIRANASTLSHAELDEAAELDAGDPADLARRYADLKRLAPSIRVLGGCCGTDERHVAAICDALVAGKTAA